MAKRPKELQQLAALPAELEPELQFDAQSSPQGVLDRAQEVIADRATARTYLAERGLVNPHFSPLEATFRGAAIGSVVMGVGSLGAAIVGIVSSDLTLGTMGMLGSMAAVFALPLEFSMPAPRIVKGLGAQITQARREKLRAWASTRYGTEVDDELLLKLQSELAARDQEVLVQLQSRLTLAQPEGSVPKILQRIVAESPGGSIAVLDRQK